MYMPKHPLEHKYEHEKPLLALEQVSLEIKDEKQNPTSNRYLQAEKAEREIKHCIALLKARINWDHTPRRLYYRINLLAVLISIIHLIVSWTTFDTRITRYDYTINPETNERCDEGNGPFEASLGFITAQGEKCPTYIKEGKLSDACAEALREVCSGPGMWTGYVPTIIVVGVLFPILLSLCQAGFSCCFIAPNDKQARAQGKNLNPDDKRIIERVAEKYKITYSDDMYCENLLEHFDAAFKTYELSLVEYRSRLAFVKGQKYTNQPISMLFCDSNLRAPQLCHSIFEFADLDNGANIARKTLMNATHAKNSGTTLHRFFNVLKYKNKEGDAIYSKEKIINNIFRYAGIQPKY